MSFASKLLLVLLLAACLIACGGPADRIRERQDALAASPTPTLGERDISGAFEVTGSAGGGLEPYTGSLTVEPQSDLYSFKWRLSKGSFAGTGIQNGSNVAVSFAPTGGGKGCGIMLYKIAPGGSTLSGRFAELGGTQFAIENAVRTEGTTLVGKYSVTGTTADGKPYTGTLETKKDGEGYDFIWKTDRTYAGFGILRGSVAAVSIGGPQCSFALYDVNGNDLEGFWGGQKQITFGRETAKR